MGEGLFMGLGMVEDSVLDSENLHFSLCRSVV